MSGLLRIPQSGLVFGGGGGSGSGSGNTGVPLGPVDDWAGLAALSPAENSLAGVESLGLGNANGIAIYDGAQWQLYSGIFDTVADLNAFAEPVMTGAVASVEETGDDNENGVRYQYDGAAWARSAALSSGYAWVLSSITDTDPSGVGATRTGDYGSLNGRIYRLTAPLALPGGGTQAYWVTPEVYAGTVAVLGYLVGTEAVATDTALNAQGWPTVARTNGAITSQTTRVRLATSAASASVGIGVSTAGFTSATRVYARMLWRAVVGTQTSTQFTWALFFEFADGARSYFPGYFSEAPASGTYFQNGSFVASGPVQPSQSAVPNLSGTDDVVEVVYNGITGIAQMWRNGVLTASAMATVGAVPARLQIRSASGSTAGQTATQEVSQVVVMTW
jgi:hypothetical protein